ncbi:PaaI family thioesterase [Corynebacterium stationis]|uniref:PaaI family thioesterase n=1 Tax=Corynebacterium stationis TaxID=1705 RepID=UPI000952750C|nr:PaaI family thioesterase [Corynebacterium stationis]
MSTPKQTKEIRAQLDELLKAAHERPLNSQELLMINENTIGLDAVLGLRYTHISRGEVRAMVRVNPTLLQPWGLVNGGVFSSIAESVGSLAGVVMAGEVVVGVNNNTDFIKSVTQGIIEARATPIQAGRRSQIWNIELHHEGKLVALSKLRTMTLG